MTASAKSGSGDKFAAIAQLVERCVEGAGVAGSTPACGTKLMAGWRSGLTRRL